MQWLVKRAKGGFGIIINCAVHVCQSVQGWINELGIYDDLHLPGLKRLSETLKTYENLNIIQIFHGAARSARALTGKQPMSASIYKIDNQNFEEPREMSHKDISDILNKFAAATESAYKAGFDGVEIHEANGYILTQFLSTQSNLRKTSIVEALKTELVLFEKS
ncbi:hypothetical protein [Fluviispira multicolorata]|uniref:NADH:flavin oxidoreductase/NADH oxidase N-terminal domain-containing protein n=1 Tax=Fluviispira multicolorata TaxID=2654512 RepID=A0A833JDR3_9BACT|nr:hypothetical protein [Fluviispira multicolorata]KAB8030887.1 hypothetical protein GCL57_07890 [Fluviispira multicolorata]